jgi:hypothetical protein
LKRVERRDEGGVGFHRCGWGYISNRKRLQKKGFE